MRRMQGLDTAMFEAETPTMHLHVVGVLVLDPATAPPGWGHDTVVDLLRERIHLLPPLRWRAVTVPGGIDQPRWIEDPDFDLRHHVHHVTLDAPGDGEALARVVGGIAGVPLDRSRPLWEMHVVDGAADGSVALVAKLHHAFMDGGAGSELLSSLFDLTPEPEPVPEPDEPWTPDVVPHPLWLLGASAGGALTKLGRIPGASVATARGVVAATRRRLDGTPSAGGLMGPSTPINGPLSADRAVAFTQCSLAQVKRTRAAFGVTVNDVMLAAVTTALRDELLERGALPDRPLVAMMPISERSDGELEFSNRTAAVAVALPVHVEDPVERLRAVHELALDAKHRHATRGVGALEDWLTLVPPALVRAVARTITEAKLARFLPPAFNLVLSNIPGPPIPLHLAGARVTHLYPMGPLFEGVGINVTLLSQGDTIDIGVLSCPDLVDDPGRVGRRFLAALDDLARLADDTGRASPGAPAPASPQESTPR